MSMVTALIVEDEPLATRKLRGLVAEVAWLDCLGAVADGRTAVRAIDELQPDLVFLDIRLPGLSGLEVLQQVRHVPAVIFTTAYDRHAVTAFEMAALDYLLKPFGRERFLKAMARARPRLTESSDGDTALSHRVQEALAPSAHTRRRIFARDDGRIIPVRLAEVVRFEACDDFVLVHLRDRTLRLNLTLSAIESQLDAQTFVRVHRSHLVNLDHVAEIVPYDASRLMLRFRDGTEVVASRQRSRAFRETGL